jgi:co-chaperonin GroES (HSP10)
MYLQGVMDKIIVKVLITKEKVTEGGIVLTDEVAKNQEPQVAGIVVSVGKTIGFNLEVGDIILFHNRAGMDIIIDKVIYKVLKDQEVYGILRDDNYKENLGSSHSTYSNKEKNLK